MTETQLRAKRFHHLSYLQRRDILVTIEKEIEPVRGLWGLTEVWKKRAARRLARKYGMQLKAVLDVYEYMVTKKHEGEV